MSESVQNLTSSAQRVQEALRDAGVRLQVVELPASTRSAAEAADAIGCRLEQIAKSIVVDAHLMTLESLWAAAGTPHAVFQLTPDDLVRITGGRVLEIS